MTPEQAEQALAAATAGGRGPKAKFTPEQRKARQRAFAFAAADARTTLAHLHPDEYRALYQAAAARRLADLDA